MAHYYVTFADSSSDLFGLTVEASTPAKASDAASRRMNEICNSRFGQLNHMEFGDLEIVDVEMLTDSEVSQLNKGG